MSSSATPAPAPAQLEVPNKLTFHDHEHTLELTYYPSGFGPIPHGTQAGPKLEYTGEEGSQTFTGDQIQTLDSPMGQLLSVVLRPNADAGGLNFTLVLPKVTEPHGKTEAFKTLGVKTRTRGFVVAPGPDRTYTSYHLHGLAQKVMLPL